jgi:hypothetical protein
LSASISIVESFGVVADTEDRGTRPSRAALDQLQEIALLTPTLKSPSVARMTVHAA